MRMVMVLLLVTAFVLVQSAQAESIYRCKENGLTVFSEIPCAGAEMIQVPESSQAPEGHLSGVVDSWQEISRRVNTTHSKDPQKGSRVDKETEVTIACLPSKEQRSVFIRNDTGTIYLRDGDDVSDPKTGRTIRRVGSKFSSLDEAAKAACSKLL